MSSLLDDTADKGSLFGGMTADKVTRVLRIVLAELKVQDAHTYCTHDLRRGHCEDLVESGQPLQVILAAGGWNSQAFKVYLDRPRLATNAVLQAVLLKDGELTWN